MLFVSSKEKYKDKLLEQKKNTSYQVYTSFKRLNKTAYTKQCQFLRACISY